MTRAGFVSLAIGIAALGFCPAAQAQHPQYGPAPQQGYAPQYPVAPQYGAAPQYGYASQHGYGSPGYGAPPPPAAGYAPPPPARAVAPNETASEVERREAALRPRLVIKGYNGTGGAAEVEIGNERIRESDMDFTPGIAAEFVYPVTPNVGVGLLTGVRFWKDEVTEALDLDPHVLLDLNAVLQLRLPISRTGSNLYLALPIGLSLNFMDDDSFYRDVELSSNVGFNFGLMAGAQVMFGRVFGLMAEIGYVRHHASTEYSSDYEGTFDLDWYFGQLSFNTGMVFAF